MFSNNNNRIKTLSMSVLPGPLSEQATSELIETVRSKIFEAGNEGIHLIKGVPLENDQHASRLLSIPQKVSV